MEEEREQQRLSTGAAEIEDDDDSIEEIEVGGAIGDDADNEEGDLLLLLGEGDDDCDDPRSLSLFEDVVTRSDSDTLSDSSYRGPGAILPASPFACGALSLLRSFSQSGERSRRARAVATAVIERVNAADYSAWQLRWECSLSLMMHSTSSKAKIKQQLLSLAESESKLCARVSARNGFKNYQLWNHRAKVVAEAARVEREEESEDDDDEGNNGGVASRIAREELSFACAALCDDAKNYHAWSHRCLVASQLPPPSKKASPPSSSSRRRRRKAWADERDFAAGAISEDPRSNSAWEHRAAAVDALLHMSMTTTRENEGEEGDDGDDGGDGRASKERDSRIVEEEFELASAHARAMPHDFPAWSHVRAVACWASELDEERDKGKGKVEGEKPEASRGVRRRKNLLPLSLASDARYASLAASVLAEEPGCTPALLLLHDAHALRALWASKAAVAEQKEGTAEAATSIAEASSAIAAACRSRLAEVDPTRVGLWASIG